jgi:hypothetical protein
VGRYFAPCDWRRVCRCSALHPPACTADAPPRYPKVCALDVDQDQPHKQSRPPVSRGALTSAACIHGCCEGGLVPVRLSPSQASDAVWVHPAADFSVLLCRKRSIGFYCSATYFVTSSERNRLSAHRLADAAARRRLGSHHGWNVDHSAADPLPERPHADAAGDAHRLPAVRRCPPR